jgi:hypothetical protein
MGWLDPEELKQLLPAETSAFRSPIPTQSVSSDALRVASSEANTPSASNTSRAAARIASRLRRASARSGRALTTSLLLD